MAKLLFRSRQLSLCFQPEFEVHPNGFACCFPFLICPLANFLMRQGFGSRRSGNRPWSSRMVGLGRQRGRYEYHFFFHESAPSIFLQVNDLCCLATFERKTGKCPSSHP